jgi:hypothetical protein
VISMETTLVLDHRQAGRAPLESVYKPAPNKYASACSAGSLRPTAGGVNDPSMEATIYAARAP